MRSLTAPTDLVDGSIRFKTDALRAVKALARTKPWQGKFDARFENLQTCLRAMCEAYGVEPIQLTHVGSRSGTSAASRWRPKLRRIELRGRLSVVMMLHLFGKASFGCRGIDQHLYAMRWSATLFKRCFPLSFSRCRLVGGLLVNDGRRDD